jgi:hypothetical protein
MPDQIYIGKFAKGLSQYFLPFNIDNDTFPFMVNFYVWRGRAKRKRGTIFLGRLQRQLQISTTPNNYQVHSFALVAGAGNFIVQYSLGSSSSIVPGSINIVVGANTYTDPGMDGVLVGIPAGSGTINYTTGAFTITGGGAGVVTGNATASFSYFPGLPVMGLREFISLLSSSQYPLLIAFDTKYAYQINQNSATVFFYNVTYYKNTNTPFVWNGANYQQFWTTNYQNALWATNNKPGFHFENINTIVVGNPTTINTSANHNLITGDYVFFNEITGADAGLLNLTTQQVTVTSPTQFTVPVNTTAKAINNSGIFQTLTSSGTTPTEDGIRWYDGDPTSGTGIPTGTGRGWVNFAPPLTATTVSINDLTSKLYYLVGALAIVPFKDRLLFFSPYIQATDGNPAIQLQDTVIWSWNGTPYYSSLVPTLPVGSETFDPTAYYVDQTGKGGYLSAGIQRPIITVNSNEDVLLVGFSNRQMRFVYTGDDLFPFLFFIINSELGSSATFSGITLDRGALTIGSYGIALTTQQSTQRVDLDIPDQVFDIQALNNGVQRVNSARDFFKEWIYFSYPTGSGNSPIFPTQTFLYNYRDTTWAILYENFTAHGTYRKSSKYTWKTIPFPTWAQWNEPWNSGSTTALFPSIVAGNPQGYVLIKGQGTGEGLSGAIKAIANNGGFTQITSINHCVTNANPLTGDGDFLYFQGALTTTTATITNISQASQALVTAVNTFSAGQYVFISEVVGMTQINGRFVQIVSATAANFTINLDTTTFTAYSSAGIATYAPLQNQIGKVTSVIDADNFVVDIPFPTGTYIGLGQFVRLSQPLIQTKQFPFYWEQGRQVRLSAQKYLLDMTATGQITANIYLSQDADNPWNTPLNNSVVYSQTVFTCPESTNIGLTAFNTNLQMPTAESQYQIWHRYNTSLIGDTFQIGLTLSDAQMRDYYLATAEIALHGMHLTVDKAGHLA